MSSSPPQNFVVLGAGVVGLTTALVLRARYPSSNIIVTATHFPGDRSISYTSPWAGANWSSFANDNGVKENYDRVTFHKFEEIAAKHPEAGLSKIPMWGFFDSKLEDTGVLTPETGRIWYEELVGGIRTLGKEEIERSGKGAVVGLEFGKSWRINTQVYLQWLQNYALISQITLHRQTYPSLSSIITTFPDTTVLLNCSALGSLALADVHDTTMYPTRGQTVLIAEPDVPLERMYFRSEKRTAPVATYVFPRPLGGGVILGGSRQDGEWNEKIDKEMAREIMERCCALAPELGRAEDLKVISHNVGLRPSRKAGVRIELEHRSNGVPVVHNYGHSGAGYQSSWGTAEAAVELVKKALDTKAKL